MLIEEAVSAFNSNETVEVVEIVDSAMTPSGDEVSATSDGAPPEGEVAAPPTETPAPVEQAVSRETRTNARRVWRADRQKITHY